MPKVKRRIDVMPSSTTRDLPEHRKNVIDAIIRVGWYPLAMEFDVTTNDAEAVSYSLGLVDESEVYILILGTRYGYVPEENNPKQISITQMEYEHALTRPNLKRLYFVMDLDKHSIKAGDLDKEDSARHKMEVFRERVLNKHHASLFGSVEELRSQVIQALYELRLDMPLEEAEEAEKKSIPLPPTLYAFPSYSDQNAPFVGRKAEMKLLNQWAHPDSQKAMLILEAIGGMGKSALAWKWMQDRAVAFDGYFWYSFYEGGADMRECLRHALAYVSHHDPDELKGRDTAKMLTELESVLKQNRYLLVLDGLERVLLAYHRWDAAQMQDDAVPEERDHRATTDPQDADVLKRLVACSPSRILLSSRLLPTALEDGGTVLSGVERVQLLGLSPEDARRFWSDKGIKWSDEGRLDTFIGQFGRHSLLLKLIGGQIVKSRRSFEAWYEIYGENIIQDKDITAKRSRILAASYQDLSEDARKVLSQIAALGGAVDLNTLNIFNPYLPPMPEEVEKPSKSFDTFQWQSETNSEKAYLEAQRKQEELEFQEKIAAKEAYLAAKDAYPKSREYKQAIAAFDALLQELEERGLLWWDKVMLQYDLHPVVRGYAIEQLDESLRPQTFDKIYNYFDAQERDFDLERVKSLRDLQNSITMYNALIGAKKFGAASQLFSNRLLEVMIMGGLGLYRKAYELLLPLFPDGLTELPVLSEPKKQRSVLSWMGAILGYMNRNQEALQVKGLRLKLELITKQHLEVGLALANYANSLRNDNQLAQSLRGREYYHTIANLNNEPDAIAKANYYLLEAYTDLGYWDEADSAYQAFNTIPPNAQTNLWQALLVCSYARSLLDRGASSQIVLNTITEAERLNEKRDEALTKRELKWLKGEVLLQMGKIQEAQSLFSEAVRMGNESGLSYGSGWGGLARAHLQAGNEQEALRIIHEEITDDDGTGKGYSAAYVYWKTGQSELATESALKYYTWSWAQGEPYVNRFHLERARALLQEMGIEEPQLPLWDEAKYLPFLYEEEAKAFIEELKRKKADES